MNPPLRLVKADYFPSDLMPVVVVDRSPQPSFPLHNHEFNELVIVWRGNGLHVMNDKPWLITCGDLFYIGTDDCHSYESVHDLVLDNIIYCPERFQLGVDLRHFFPYEQVAWRLTIRGMSLVRGVILQLSQEGHKSDQLSRQLAETLFLQLLLILQRHRYRADCAWQLPGGEQLDLLMSAIGGQISHHFDLSMFCETHQLSERALKQLFRQQTGMMPAQYLRQLRLCKAKFLLRSTTCLIGEVAARCGFDDSNYFSVVFTRETGMTPSAFRQQFEQHAHRAKITHA
ncbi:HTH-type transcriptional activator RhaR [Erwinia tracheiphila]|uniref:Arabinose operon regulatory protein n=1 Tax=Erwinia tracheiphila TaxID=65700 RepID=A0A0M2KBM6_9GAMM|nr:HTH-type transcriptional activator RhaR [Erwinia tracheiphila]EOS96887.1 transcriptional activator RhaR [Erwinia tracheiphila PSU-1]KKF34682.1 transcriptional regulator [Erwinia tracheiphila]UIA86354.1 HTH-type transcriptional activator RhaR [Erwinia tracheiphila]UIA94674.1 HTH-type transcriptional activator RhaR [Erwinia tracheiphila]